MCARAREAQGAMSLLPQPRAPAEAVSALQEHALAAQRLLDPGLRRVRASSARDRRTVGLTRSHGCAVWCAGRGAAACSRLWETALLHIQRVAACLAASRTSSM
jgi:hypothetical protein